MGETRGHSQGEYGRLGRNSGDSLGILWGGKKGALGGISVSTNLFFSFDPFLEDFQLFSLESGGCAFAEGELPPTAPIQGIIEACSLYASNMLQLPPEWGLWGVSIANIPHFGRSTHHPAPSAARSLPDATSAPSAFSRETSQTC